MVIQCNGHVDEFRQWLSDHGFKIDDERIVKDSHYYQLISMHKEETTPLNEGTMLIWYLYQKDPLIQRILALYL